MSLDCGEMDQGSWVSWDVWECIDQARRRAMGLVGAYDRILAVSIMIMIKWNNDELSKMGGRGGEGQEVWSGRQDDGSRQRPRT